MHCTNTWEPLCYPLNHTIARFLVRRNVPHMPAVAGLWMLSKRRRQPLASKSMHSSSGATSSDGFNVFSLVSAPLQQTRT